MASLVALVLAFLASETPVTVPGAVAPDSAPPPVRLSIDGLPPGTGVLLVRGRPGRERVLLGRLEAGGRVTFELSAPAPEGPAAVSAAPPLRGFGPTPPVSLASDSFNGSALGSAWSVLNPAAAAVTVSGGALHLEPTAGGPEVTWFADEEGVFVHQTLRGDFTVRSTVEARSVSAPGSPPPAEYRLGGLLVRDPASVPGNRNSLHLAVGAGDLASPVAVEDKSTVASVSAFFFHDVPDSRCELRIRRRGDRFTLQYRAGTGSPWSLARVLVRPDLPHEVQVGMMAYSFPAGPDLRVSFEQFVVEKTP